MHKIIPLWSQTTIKPTRIPVSTSLAVLWFEVSVLLSLSSSSSLGLFLFDISGPLWSSNSAKRLSFPSYPVALMPANPLDIFLKRSSWEKSSSSIETFGFLLCQKWRPFSTSQERLIKKTSRARIASTLTVLLTGLHFRWDLCLNDCPLIFNGRGE